MSVSTFVSSLLTGISSFIGGDLTATETTRRSREVSEDDLSGFQIPSEWSSWNPSVTSDKDTKRVKECLRKEDPICLVRIAVETNWEERASAAALFDFAKWYNGRLSLVDSYIDGVGKLGKCYSDSGLSVPNSNRYKKNFDRYVDRVKAKAKEMKGLEFVVTDEEIGKFESKLEEAKTKLTSVVSQWASFSGSSRNTQSSCSSISIPKLRV